MLHVYVSQMSPTATKATAKLVSGPATPTHAIPRWPSLKWRGSTGTGLAQPRKAVPLDSRYVTASATVPHVSMCLMGLSDSRPCALAVGSPSR